MKSFIGAWILAFALSAAATPALIPLLRRLKFGQQIREEGVKEHLKKAGTPTMGGIAFLAAITVTALVFGFSGFPEVFPVLGVTLGFGLIGFADDFLKTVKKQSEGLKVWQKFLAQLLVAGAFCFYQMTAGGGTEIVIPFGGGTVDLGWIYVPFALLVIIGTDNGSNFTDGLDGLCGSVTCVIAMFLAYLSLSAGGGIHPIAAAVAGAMAGFLLYNTNPAKLFMGDTGSLALGAFVASSALVLKQPLLLVPAAVVYLAEVLSVMLQVGYFKLTKGKRIFRMAPIHHHFELGGWSEPKVVAVFTVVTAVGCLIALLAAGV